ncbi:hypothetical protein V6N11_065120 [Hibiscus sabdariffa]|uniref:Uncharacterized protein n=1 Tax=Hibiscus sabdariffa TaxID=183260 RepID=A0ABR2SJL9_9ROSI
MLLPLAVELGGVLVDGLWASASQKCHSHHLMRYELLLCHRPGQRGWQMVWAVCWWGGGWRLWSGTASSDWAGGGGWGASGVEPMGESGVLSLLAGRSVGVAAGLGMVWLADWLGSAGAGDAAAGLKDPASSVGAVGM